MWHSASLPKPKPAMHDSNNCSLMPIRGYSNSQSWFSGSVAPDPVVFRMLKGLEVHLRLPSHPSWLVDFGESAGGKRVWACGWRQWVNLTFQPHLRNTEHQICIWPPQQCCDCFTGYCLHTLQLYYFPILVPSGGRLLPDVRFSFLQPLRLNFYCQIFVAVIVEEQSAKCVVRLQIELHIYKRNNS